MDLAGGFGVGLAQDLQVKCDQNLRLQMENDDLRFQTELDAEATSRMQLVIESLRNKITKLLSEIAKRDAAAKEVQTHTQSHSQSQPPSQNGANNISSQQRPSAAAILDNGADAPSKSILSEPSVDIESLVLATSMETGAVPLHDEKSVQDYITRLRSALENVRLRNEQLRRQEEYQAKIIENRREHVEVLEVALKESNALHRQQMIEHGQKVTAMEAEIQRLKEVQLQQLQQQQRQQQMQQNPIINRGAQIVVPLHPNQAQQNNPMITPPNSASTHQSRWFSGWFSGSDKRKHDPSPIK